MIIGVKDRFAIEFELDAAKLADPTLAEWLHGRIRWWSGGEQIGRYEDDTTIRDVVIAAEHFLSYEGRRLDEDLLRAPARDVLRTAVDALYADHGQSDEQVKADADRYSRFVVAPGLDELDRWRILLVEGETSARLIWMEAPGEAAPHEQQLDPGEFDEVLKEFLDIVREKPRGYE
jgi:Immunity protein 42